MKEILLDMLVKLCDKINFLLITPILFVMLATASIAKEYVIYSIAQNIPMGIPNEVIKKNFYINMGRNQGLKKGHVLDVYRKIYKLNPFENNLRYAYRIEVGKLSVIHAENEASIAIFKNETEDKNLLLDHDRFLIGDEVQIHIKKDEE